MASDRVSFTLKDGVENFVGGTVVYGTEGAVVDLEPLAKSGTIITVANPLQANALRDVEALKEVPTPDAHEGQELEEEDEVLVYQSRSRGKKGSRSEGGES